MEAAAYLEFDIPSLQEATGRNPRSLGDTLMKLRLSGFISLPASVLERSLLTRTTEPCTLPYSKALSLFEFKGEF